MTSNSHYVLLYSIESDERQKRFEAAVRASYVWWKFTPSAMVVCTGQTPDQLQKVLQSWIDTAADRFAVMQLREYGARRGWMNKEAWDWLNEHIGVETV
jgi:hypothetical protein